MNTKDLNQAISKALELAGLKDSNYVIVYKHQDISSCITHGDPVIMLSGLASVVGMITSEKLDQMIMVNDMPVIDEYSGYQIDMETK